MNIEENVLYKGNDDKLLTLKQQTAELIYRINHSLPSERTRIHQDVFPKLLKKLGQNSWFETPFYCDYGQFIEIGNDCYINHHCTIGDGGLVKIGNHVMIGPNVSIYTAEHPLEPNKRKQGWQYVQNITIEDNVWIGGNCVILSGVTIGQNSVIGAGSVITKSIPANVLAYGNPCQVIKELPHEPSDK